MDLTIAVSPSQIPDLIAVGYRKSNIRVIPNGVPDLAPTRPAAVVRAELDLDEDLFVAVLAARLEPLKQADVFVDAVVRAHRVDDRIRGLVIGSGSEFPRIEALAGDTSGIVRTLGERMDIVDLLAMADVVGLTSKSEALPMVVLEAMALRRPVVATAVGGVPDALADGVAGLLVPPGDAAAFADALVGLAHDPALGGDRRGRPPGVDPALHGGRHGRRVRRRADELWVGSAHRR
jgi:glycosyltransferase involved in cell wall biosynthesis